ncbi:MAG: DUF4300 family protein [Eubacteriales bacterium]|nr:DUF4300 family protein [Eubacteriales bacterium]
MKKKIMVMMTGLLLAALISGCRQKDEPKSQNQSTTSSTSSTGKSSTGSMIKPGAETGTYAVSNLTDDAVEQELQAVMKEAGVSDARAKVFFDHVTQFNSCPGMEGLISGYERLGSTEQRFDEYKLQEAWDQEHPDFSGYNCRITSYMLMADQIMIDEQVAVDQRNLALDLAALAEDKTALLDEEKTEKFEQLFTTIKAADSRDSRVQAELVEKHLSEMGLTFKENPAMSLVTVYVNTNYGNGENELFVGHTGILFDRGEEGLYFVEKLAFQAPYRLLKLTDKAQLWTYLREHYASFQGPDEAAPFIMENGKYVAEK